MQLDMIILSGVRKRKTNAIWSCLYLDCKIWDNWGLSGCPGGYESTCQCRGHGFSPWPRKIPRAVGQLSPLARPALCSERSRRDEKPAPRHQEQTPLITATREKPLPARKTRHSLKDELISLTKWTYLWNRNRIMLIENTLVVAKDEGAGGRMEREVGVRRRKLLYTE